MQIIAVAIQKGGTGKTTTAAAIAHAAAEAGHRVLAIDLDPQANFSYTMAADTTKPGSYDLIMGKTAAELVQQITDKIDIIPANWELSTITSSKGSARRLQKAIEPLKKSYDLIIIDTPPTAGELQYNAMQAATGLVIPLQADIYCLQSFYQVADTAREIMKSNPALIIKGYILTQHNGRSTITKQMQQAIAENAEQMNVACLGIVRAGVAVKEAAALQQSLFDYAPKSNPAKDYREIYNNLEI